MKRESRPSDAEAASRFLTGNAPRITPDNKARIEFSLPAGMTPWADDPKNGAPTPLSFIDGASFILDIPDDIPALVGDGEDVLWAEGESFMIAGSMGLGKTSLAGQLIHEQCGLGEGLFLSLPVARRAKILYLAMDRPAQAARAFKRQFDEDTRRVLASKVTIWKGPPPEDLAANPTLLTSMARAAGADTVYIDSLKDAAIGLSEDAVGAGYNRARQHSLNEGIQLCELHHTTKRSASGGPPVNVADIYGSAWLANGAGSIVLLSGEPGDPIIGLRHVKQPASELGPWRLIRDVFDGRLTIDHEADLVAIAEASGANGLTARGAAVAIFEKDKPSRGEIERARRRLELLADAGQLVRVDGSTGGQGGGSSSAYFRP